MWWHLTVSLVCRMDINKDRKCLSSSFLIPSWILLPSCAEPEIKKRKKERKKITSSIRVQMSLLINWNWMLRYASAGWLQRKISLAHFGKQKGFQVFYLYIFFFLVWSIFYTAELCLFTVNFLLYQPNYDLFTATLPSIFVFLT